MEPTFPTGKKCLDFILIDNAYTENLLSWSAVSWQPLESLVLGFCYNTFSSWLWLLTYKMPLLVVTALTLKVLVTRLMRLCPAHATWLPQPAPSLPWMTSQMICMRNQLIQMSTLSSSKTHPHQITRPPVGDHVCYFHKHYGTATIIASPSAPGIWEMPTWFLGNAICSGSQLHSVVTEWWPLWCYLPWKYRCWSFYFAMSSAFISVSFLSTHLSLSCPSMLDQTPSLQDFSVATHLFDELLETLSDSRL